MGCRTISTLSALRAGGILHGQRAAYMRLLIFVFDPVLPDDVPERPLWDQGVAVPKSTVCERSLCRYELCSSQAASRQLSGTTYYFAGSSQEVHYRSPTACSCTAAHDEFICSTRNIKTHLDEYSNSYFCARLARTALHGGITPPDAP